MIWPFSRRMSLGVKFGEAALEVNGPVDEVLGIYAHFIEYLGTDEDEPTAPKRVGFQPNDLGVTESVTEIAAVDHEPESADSPESHVRG